MTSRTTRYWGSLACVLGGMLWALLGPAAILETNGTLSYDNYNRLLAAPLLLVLVGFIALYRTVRPNTSAGRAGFLIASLGFVLLFAGNLIEFWGVLLQSQPNAQRASELGLDQHWVGSDIGWMIFGLGMLGLLIGGPLAALAIRRSPTLPRWIAPFVGLSLVGVLAGNLFASAPFFISLPIFASYGAGWIALGVTIWKLVPARRSTFAGSRIEARAPTPRCALARFPNVVERSHDTSYAGREMIRMRKMMRLLLLTVALTTVLVSTGTALAGHPHYLVTPGTCVEDIGQGQTSQTSGGGAHRFHDNVHLGVPGTFAMEQENNPVAVYKEGQGPGCP